MPVSKNEFEIFKTHHEYLKKQIKEMQLEKQVLESKQEHLEAMFFSLAQQVKEMQDKDKEPKYFSM